MLLHLKIIGALFILLSILHIFFPKYFDWKKDLAPLTLINRQMMYVHLFFIAFGLLLLGLLCLTSPNALLTTPLGKCISLGLSIFWALRLFAQFFIYSPKLWKNKPFETAMHILFSLLWTYLTTIFLLAYLKN